MSENKIATEVSKEKVIVSNKGLVRADYSFWVGQYLDKFYDNLENNKLVGNKCSECGDVFVPPRKICGKCNISFKVILRSFLFVYIFPVFFLQHPEAILEPVAFYSNSGFLHNL